jgi:hypothetical protein
MGTRPEGEGADEGDFFFGVYQFACPELSRRADAFSVIPAEAGIQNFPL